MDQEGNISSVVDCAFHLLCFSPKEKIRFHAHFSPISISPLPNTVNMRQSALKFSDVKLCSGFHNSNDVSLILFSNVIQECFLMFFKQHANKTCFAGERYGQPARESCRVKSPTRVINYLAIPDNHDDKWGFSQVTVPHSSFPDNQRQLGIKRLGYNLGVLRDCR
jgi:hypothetical protein